MVTQHVQLTATGAWWGRPRRVAVTNGVACGGLWWSVVVGVRVAWPAQGVLQSHGDRHHISYANDEDTLSTWRGGQEGERIRQSGCQTRWCQRQLCGQTDDGLVANHVYPENRRGWRLLQRLRDQGGAVVPQRSHPVRSAAAAATVLETPRSTGIAQRDHCKRCIYYIYNIINKTLL